MKRIYSLPAIELLLAISLVCSCAHGASASGPSGGFNFSVMGGAREIGLSGASDRPFGLELAAERLDSRAGANLEFIAAIDRLAVEHIATPAGDFTRLSVPGFHESDGVGGPALPVRNVLVQIPHGAKPSVKITETDARDTTLADLGAAFPIYPKQPSRLKGALEPSFAYDRSAYLHDAWLGHEAVTVEDAGVCRDARLALLRFYPVAYNPATGKLRITRRVRFTIELPGADIEASRAEAGSYASPAFSVLDSMALRPSSLRAPASKGPMGYLIVTDKMFISALAPFIEWKKKQGFLVDVVSTEGMANVQAGVRAAIADRYLRPAPERPAPSYLLIVGDHEQIPAFRGTVTVPGSSGHVTDLPYVAVTPGDDIPDILAGRFSAKNAGDLASQIEKTIYYEKGEFDASYLKRAVLIAGWDQSYTQGWGWAQHNYVTSYYVNSSAGMSAKTYLSNGSHQNESSIISDLSAGAALVNYTAHGASGSWSDPAVTTWDVANRIANRGKYPVVIANACLTNKFDDDSCMGETWLRVKDRGAVAYIGGTDSTCWDEDLWWAVGYHQIVRPNPTGAPPEREKTGIGAYDALFQGRTSTPSGMILAGNLAVTESNSYYKKHYWEIYQLMGDPSLVVRAGK